MTHPDEFRNQPDAGGVAENLGIDLVSSGPFLAVGKLKRMLSDHRDAKLKQAP